MPSSIYEYELGTYLLQTKYKIKYVVKINEELVDMYQDVQTCHEILKKNSEQHYPMIHLAAIWSYNAISNTTKFTIVLHESVNFLDLGFNIKESVTFKGLHKTLTLNKNLIV